MHPGVLLAAFIVAIGGVIYELILGGAASLLFGNGIAQFSFTIGMMLFGMGLGAYLTPTLERAPERHFVLVELLIGILGGTAPALLFFFAGWAPDYARPAFFAVALALGIGIGTEVPLLFRIVKKEGRELLALSRILALDYVGSLIASLLFPLVLLPALGIVRTALIFGLVNAIVALGMRFAFAGQMPRSRALTAACIAAVALLGAGVWQAESLSRRLESKLYQDEIVYAAQTPYQRIVLTRYRDDLRLYLNRQLQFSTVDEYRYHEPLVHLAMAAAAHRGKVLVLGGGDGLAVRELLKWPDVASVDLVDLDPAMVEIARSYAPLVAVNRGSLNDPRIRIHAQDAMEFLAEGTDRYDVIVADLPDPNDESLAKLYSLEFYGLVRRRLAKDGAFVAQATSPYAARQTFWTIAETVRAAGFSALPFHVQVPTFGDWGFILGTDRPVDRARLRIPDAIPRRFLTAEILPTLFLFDADMAPLPSATSTLLAPTVYQTYLKAAETVEGR